MNAIEKLYALIVSDEINVWHYPGKQENPRFFYWHNSEPHLTEGHGFDTLEQMIDAAYERIDPLKKPLPERILPPTSVLKVVD